MRPANPYADLRALLDSTRRLDPEEVAELQLEQGYADRALAIYEGLLAREPANSAYRRRRDWLARMATVRQRPVRCVSASSPPPPTAPARDSLDATLRGVLPPHRRRRSTARGHAAPDSSPVSEIHGEIPPARAAVRRLAIVGVR